jgi:hypothetical protein
VLVAPNVGISPTTGLLLASFRVIVTVDVATPSATTGVVPLILEFATTAPPGVKTTELPALTNGVAIERTFVSAKVELKAQIESPEASEREHEPYVLEVPVALNVGV